MKAQHKDLRSSQLLLKSVFFEMAGKYLTSKQMKFLAALYK